MDFKQLTYRQKNILLLISALLFLVVAYFLSFEKTYEVWKSNQELEQQAEMIQDLPSKLNNLRGQLETFEVQMKNFASDTASKEEYLLEKISKSCYQHKVTLVSLPPPSFFTENQLNVETRFVKLRGGFIELLLMVNEIENQFRVGRVSSVRFVLEEDRKNNTQYLFANIYIQNLKKLND